MQYGINYVLNLVTQSQGFGVALF